jgi:hypothetical protein
MSILAKKLLKKVSGGAAVAIDGVEFLGDYPTDLALMINDTISGTQTDGKRMTIAFWVSLASVASPVVNGGAIFFAGESEMTVGILCLEVGIQIFITIPADVELTLAVEDPLFAVTEDPAFLMVSIDTTQANLVDRVRVWFGGAGFPVEEITNEFTIDPADLAQNTVIPVDAATINDYVGIATVHGILGDIHFIDGQAITDPSAFVANHTTAAKPGTYTGSYGNNGFHLDFSNPGDLGNDVSGNNYDFTIDVDPDASLTHEEDWIVP